MNSTQLRRLFFVPLFALLASCAAGTETSDSTSDVAAAESTNTTVAATGDVATDDGSDSTTGTTESTTTQPDAPVADAIMPDVVGENRDVAAESLVALGIDDFRFIESASLQPAGQILSQVPSPGTTVRGPVSLTVAIPLPPMPDYAGTRIGTARTELAAWGVVVAENPVLSTERPAGEVLKSIPSAGDQIGSEVVLDVAVSPVIGLLGTDATLVESGIDGGSDRRGFSNPKVGPIEVNGSLYEDSHWSEGSTRTSAGDSAYWEFDLGRDWESFEAEVGLWDKSEFEQSGRFRIILDGAPIWEQDVKFGETIEISRNVSGGLRLRLEVVSLGEGRLTLVWGSPRLLGLPGVAGGG